MSKKWLFWGSHVCTRLLQKFNVSHHGQSNWQDHRTVGGTGCWNKREATLYNGKLRFRPKNIKEKAFFAVFKVCTKTFWNFVVCIRWCSISLNSRPMGYTRCCGNIKGNYKAESFVLSKKNIGKGFFGVFRSASHFPRTNHPKMLKLGKRSLIDCARCCNNEKGIFLK